MAGFAANPQGDMGLMGEVHGASGELRFVTLQAVLGFELGHALCWGMALRAVFGCWERFAVLLRLHRVTRIAVVALQMDFMRCGLWGLHEREKLDADMTSVAAEGSSRMQRLLCDMLSLRPESSHVLGAAAQERAHIVNIMHPETTIFFDELNVLLSFFIEGT